MPLADMRTTIPSRTDLIKLEPSDILKLPLNDQQKEDITSVLGIQYTPGGETRQDGFDCSGLVYWMCSCPIEKRDIPGTRASATMIYNWAIKDGKMRLTDNKKAVEKKCPVVLAIDKITPTSDIAHTVLVYGTVMRDNQKYYVVVQAGQAHGIGNNDSTVSAYLVAEKRFFKTYGDFVTYYPRRKKIPTAVAIRP
ncbi:MAG: hypothetical protein ABID61_01490 [Candidatus Micrarchaeota archaeon]